MRVLRGSLGRRRHESAREQQASAAHMTGQKEVGLAARSRWASTDFELTGYSASIEGDTHGTPHTFQICRSLKP